MGGRDIHHHIALAEGEGGAGDALGGGSELAEALGGGDVHLVQRAAGDHARLAQAMAELKALHGLGQRLVEDVAAGAAAIILADGEAALEQGDVGPLGALAQGDALGQLRPTPRLDDREIAF